MNLKVARRFNKEELDPMDRLQKEVMNKCVAEIEQKKNADNNQEQNTITIQSKHLKEI